MFKTQKKFEETIIVKNQSITTRGSGGIGLIDESSGVQIKALMLPDQVIFRENRREGNYRYERLFAHIRKTEMDKADFIPGRTLVEWNGYNYRVVGIIDYTSKPLFKNAEVEMRRKLDSQ